LVVDISQEIMNATGFQVIENGAVVGGGTFSNELQSLGNGSQALVQQGQTLGGAFDLGGSLLSSNELQSFGNSITGIAGGSNPEGTGTANDTGALGGLFGSGGSSGNGSLTDTVMPTLYEPLSSSWGLSSSRQGWNSWDAVSYRLLLNRHFANDIAF